MYLLLFQSTNRSFPSNRNIPIIIVAYSQIVTTFIPYYLVMFSKL